MKKKAIAMTLASIFALFIIVILLILYLSVTGVFSAQKSFAFPKPYSINSKITQNSLPLKTISIKFHDVSAHDMLVIDAISLWLEKRDIRPIPGNAITDESMAGALRPLVNENAPCLFISDRQIISPSGESKFIFVGWKLNEQGASERFTDYLAREHYEEKIIFVPMEVNGETKNLRFYLDKCKEEQ